MAKYEITRTVMMRQHKVVEGPDDARPNDIIQMSFGFPWMDGVVFGSDEVKVQKLRDGSDRSKASARPRGAG
jgi:hypothetical protein